MPGVPVPPVPAPAVVAPVRPLSVGPADGAALLDRMGHFKPSPAPLSGSGLDLDSASVPDFVRALCLATGHWQYVLSPDVVDLSKKLTVQIIGPDAAVWEGGLTALRSAGVSARCAPKGGLCEFYVAPPAPDKKTEVATAVFSYVPRFRDVAFLASSLASMFSGWHFAGTGSAAGAASSAVSASVPSGGSSSAGVSVASSGHAMPAEAVADRLVGIGPVTDRAKVLDALRSVDQPVPGLVVRLGVYEVDVSKSDQSAIQVVANILGQSLTLGGSAATSLASSGLAGLTFKIGSFSGVAQALDSSSLVHSVTRPVLRTSSGVMASFAVGDSVPTLGSVSYSGSSSTPVQSIVYQQSGVEFSVVPVVVGELVDVALYQSISSFSATSVGVTSSPTLQNRVLSSDVLVRPGEVTVLGGLMQNSDTKGSGGWWFVPRLSTDHEVAKTELVLVLSVDRS